MRTFEHPNLYNEKWRCPICGTHDDKEVVLIGIVGTQDGNIIQAEQFHSDCIELLYDKKMGLIYQKTVRDIKEIEND